MDPHIGLTVSPVKTVSTSSHVDNILLLVGEAEKLLSTPSIIYIATFISLRLFGRSVG
jgi:hypothetical protein